MTILDSIQACIWRQGRSLAHHQATRDALRHRSGPWNHKQAIYGYGCLKRFIFGHLLFKGPGCEKKSSFRTNLNVKSWKPSQKASPFPPPGQGLWHRKGCFPNHKHCTVMQQELQSKVHSKTLRCVLQSKTILSILICFQRSVLLCQLCLMQRHIL